MFIVGREFDERFPYERIEALARQPLAFLRLSVKRFFRSRSARFHWAFCPNTDKIDLFGLFRLYPCRGFRADLL